jgi:regulator of sigma E protease
METFLTSLISFIVAIGIIVTVHEFGHFIVARILDVRVLRFSVGFGQPLLKHVSPKSGVEYVLAVIPLGGYVKMLDEREGEVPADEVEQAFNRKSVYTRFAIVAAGPVFNFIFAIFAYAAMYVAGVQGMIPQVEQVESNSLAYQAGISEGDVIVKINDTPVATWEETSIRLIDEGLKTGKVALELKDQQGNNLDTVIDLSDTQSLLDEGSLMEKIGIIPWRYEPPAKLGQFTRESAAKQQGFMEGDEILFADDQPINSWEEWVEVVQQHPGKAMDVTILRDSQRFNLELVPAKAVVEDQTVGRIGVYPWVDQARIDAQKVIIRTGLWTALHKGLVQTYEMSVLTIKLLGKLIVGEASLKNISGPISIAEYAGISAQLGLATFLSTLAIISISIGILNLLPIPILDGGHLMYYLVEMIKGSPVSEALQITGQKIGILMLAGLMTLAFYNDFQRLFS